MMHLSQTMFLCWPSLAGVKIFVWTNNRPLIVAEIRNLIKWALKEGLDDDGAGVKLPTAVLLNNDHVGLGLGP